ncbi:MAG: phosphate acyltransferase PlsX [Wenzhouxiangella sp.]|nr:MAG: phosphate acyltransferase PlsX [Wenzhouxiangella sp.]
MTEATRVRIAVDAAGTDGGAAVISDAVEQVLAGHADLGFVLLADPDQAAGLSSRLASERVEVRVCEHALPADMNAAGAIRRGQGSTMWQALELVREGQADAVVSGGSTGALMALSRHLLGTLPGVERPALMAAIPTLTHPVWMLDLGANIHVDARRLLEFAQLGHVTCQVLEGKAPTIGLLNVGTEPGKGPDVIREAARLIDEDSALDYAGFIEADQVFSGTVDLVVCDGFAGNVLLKSAEGSIKLLFASLQAEFRGSFCGLLARRRLKRLHDSLDPARHNGAPMLGVRGTVIKSHGGTCSRGFARALELAALEARKNLVDCLERQLLAGY